ncbi:MAG: non-ribosomal peptide synthetase [Acetobacteraceae bacterium]
MTPPLAGSSEHDRALCLHRIIEAWAKRTPDANAVFFDGDMVSYGQLNDRASRLARQLRRQGIGVGSLVGVSMARTPAMIVGLLAILKAGAAYVPLDPRLPRERLLFLVDDAPLPVILTRGTRLTAGNALIIDLADDTRDDPGFTGVDPGVETDDLAYVIYTSGSTGQPKGVMIPHRGVVNWLVWMRDTFAVTPADVVLKKAPLTFDVSAWELFLPLISGACLVLADSERQYDPTYLARLMASTRVTIAQFVPSLMRSFLELEELPDLSALRHVMCGGEVLTPKLQAQFLERLTSEVCNSYGPTEASIGVTRWPCRRGDQRPAVPIGFAIDNTELYILDPDLNLAPPATAGELYIGGICLGRGYLNRPDLTAERFLPNPFNADGEARMYRTGDLCRFLDDGAIDFLGRIDDQVKIRGVRIELGEVEKAILAHESVEICAAAAEDRDGEAVLAAYVVPAPGRALTDRELRGFLRQKLPLSMIPTEFLFVDTLPLSANGKIDRKRLVLLRSAEPELVAPRDGIERRVGAVWQRVLKDARFGVHDDFFDIGGDSLLATQLLIRLETEFKTRVSLDRVIGAFTIEAIANILREVIIQGDTGRPAPVELRMQWPPAPPAPKTTPRGAAKEAVCRVATMDDLHGIWEVCARAFPPYAHASFEDFRDLCRHRWEDNPARTDADPLGWVLEAEDGRIVGFHGLVPTRLWVGDRTLAAIAPTTWAADPGYGRAGLTMLATYLNWGASRFLLNTTANAITSAMHETSDFGMRRIPVEDYDQRLLWVLDFKTLLRWKIEQSEMSGVLGRVAGSAAVQSAVGMTAPFVLGLAGGVRTALRSSVRGMHIRFACAPLRVDTVERFGPEFDELWDRLKHDHGVTMERSAAFLNWRHIDPPRLLGRSHALACRDNGRLLGYVALREPATTAPGHFIVTDLFYDRDNPDVLHNLMNAAFDFAVSRSASVLEVFGFHPSLIRQLRTQQPYVLRRSQVEGLGRGVSFRTILAALDPRSRDAASSTYWYRAPDPELERICSTGDWWPSGVDGDLNL